MLHNSKGLNKTYMWDVIGAENQVSQASIDLFLNQENMCEGWFIVSRNFETEEVTWTFLPLKSPRPGEQNQTFGIYLPG